MSTTMMPDTAPVAMPMFAACDLVHHSVIIFGSVVASLNPFAVTGCLPWFSQSVLPQLQLPLIGQWIGKTCHPRSAYLSAASSSGLLIVLPPPAPKSPPTHRRARHRRRVPAPHLGLQAR